MVSPCRIPSLDRQALPSYLIVSGQSEEVSIPGMGLVAVVKRVDDLITRRAKTSRIKRPLILLLDQAEAAEAEIRSLKASLKASGLPRKVKELEAKAQALEGGE